jgi:hypothetical protein
VAALLVSARLAALGIALLAAGCARPFAPRDDAAVPARTAIHAKDAPEASVAVAVLTDAEARARFGVDLAAHGLQAVWLRVTNRTATPMWLQLPALDLDYYSADEVAWVCRGEVPRAQFESLRQHLRDRSMRVRLDAGATEEGHVYVPRAVGGRYVNVELGIPGRRVVAGFPVRLPDGDFDYEDLDVARHYAGRALPDLDAAGLRAALGDLPCCTTDADGAGRGDPLNLALVGTAADVLTALSRAGWTFTHRITARSVAREVGAALAGSAYPTAPVSALYAFGRHHDVALQRGRATIAQRNHLRLWLAPFTYLGRPVWAGQISRDVGIKLTTASPTLTTHVIDPEVDESRQYLLQGLLARGLVTEFAYAAGVGRATREAPRRNLAGDPYFTDGLRLVAVVSPDPVAPAQTVRLDWEDEPGPVAGGQSPRPAADGARP